jgi:carboxypeptidase PM20D1
MLGNIAGEMGFPIRMAAANLWLFRPLLLRALSKNPITNAMIRSTFAATMSRAGNAPNVLPQKAKITVNVRLLSGDHVDQVEAYIRELAEEVIPAAAGSLSIEQQAPAEPSPISPTDSRVYRRLVSLSGEMFPQAVTTPYLVLGGTDARKYAPVSGNIYRFTPIQVTGEEKNTVHSTNESISIDNYEKMIRFYERFIEDFDKNIS